MIKEGGCEEDRHGATGCGHDAIWVRGEEVRAVADDKTSSEGKDMSFTADEVDGTLCAAGEEESGMSAA